MKLRKQEYGNDGGKKYQNRYVFSGKIVCGECGSRFKRQKTFIGKPYEYIRWSCYNHMTNIETCKMVAIKEEILKDAFIRLWNKLYTNQGQILEPLLAVLKSARRNQEQETKIAEHKNRIRELTEQNQIMNRLAAKGMIDSALFMEQQNVLLTQISEKKKDIMHIQNDLNWQQEITKTEQMISILQNRNSLMKEFEEEIFILFVEQVILQPDRSLTFRFFNHMELTEETSEGG